MPGAPRAAAVVVVYSGIVVVVLALLVQVAGSLGNSIAEFIRTSPELETQLRSFLRAIGGAAGRIRLHGRAREPGADHHPRTLNGYAQGAGRADPAGGIREHRGWSGTS